MKKYFVTIYTDPLNDFHGFTHTFIGLTHISPYDLEKQNINWYSCVYPSILEEKNLNDEGFFGFGEAHGILGAQGKVFENNHYVMDYNIRFNHYEFGSLRSQQTFQKKCILEISEEQYSCLFKNIKQEIDDTKHVTPNNAGKVFETKYIYHISDNNCVHWVQRHLENIGIELFEYKTVPDMFTILFEDISTVNKIFLKFQKIDDNLMTIKGVKAFKKWVHMSADTWKMITKQTYFKYKYYLDRSTIYILYAIYLVVEKMLNNLIENHQDIKGTFHFIYVDNGHLKIMKPENGYVPEILQYLDASKPYNNYTLCKYLYFIFIPDAEYEYIFHKYNYGEVDKEYTQAINECYRQVLLGQTENIKYYSQSLNKLLNNQKKDKIFNV